MKMNNKKNANLIVKTIKGFYEKIYSTKEVVQDKNSIFLTQLIFQN